MNRIIKKIAFGIAFIGSMFAIGETHTFTNTDEVGTFTIPGGQYAKVEMLLVGGGGAGGTVGQDINQGAAGGGGAGGVSHREVILEGGTYFVTVGKGGQKAQDLTHSWVGDDGEYTTIAFNNATNFVATIKGGGGGGSVKNGGQGTPGASGGGGSWYGEFMNGGSGTDGYGWNGGTPTDTNVGGGGGGACSTGKADGTPGDGKEVWNAIYARGGRGGNRGEQNYDPKDGDGYGFGGDGAVNGLGGKGGDGIAMINILKTFTYTEVKIPVDGEQGYTFSSLWTNEVTRVGFDLNGASTELKNGIDSIEGTTSVDCHLSGTNMVGVGQYKFTIYLKDEYRWEDGTTDPKTFGWRINEPNVVGNITVDVKKTVDWFEGTNATIAIDIHSTPETKVFVPNVLMVGGLCNAHGFSQDVLKTAINSVTKVANIDYYFYNKSSTTVAAQAHLNKGDTFNRTITMQSNNHGCLAGLYDGIRRAIDSGTQYDYIIFIFDRTKVATDFPNSQPTREAEVANWLKSFYNDNKVIWLVDNDPENDTTHGITQTPWYPSQLVYQAGGTNGNKWKSLYDYASDVSNVTGTTRTFRAWRALMGMFCPSKYSSCTETLYTQNNNHIIQNNDSSAPNNSTAKTRVKNLSGDGIKQQVIYNNSKNVAEVIEQVVKPTVATLEAHDQIYIKNGLKINGDLTDAYYTTNAQWKAASWEEAKVEWTQLTPEQLKYSDENGIELAISNVTTEAWVKLKVGVTDTGKFLTSVGAKWNERTGKWEKDPNNGPVKVEMMPDNGTKVIAEDEATTTVEWSFEAFRITGNVIYGEGDFIINGFETNEISVAKGYNPEAMFRGAPGWAVCYIEVDGQIIDDNHYMTNWFFGQISSDHDIKVAFTNIIVNPPPPEVGPTTQMYDGEGHTLEVLKDPTFLEGYEEYSNHWYMVYTTDPNADPANRSAWTTDGVVTNVGTTTVYARVCLEQPGYEDGAIVPYWIGTNTVTITPRPIEITIDDQWQTSGTRIPKTDFTYEQIGGSLVDGDEIVIDYSWTYPSQGQTAPINGTVKIVHRNEDGTTTDVTDNYAIKVNPGTYHYPPSNQVVATAPNIVKTYDGVKTNTTVTILNPNHTPTADEIRAAHNNNNQYNQIGNITETKKIEYLVDGEWTTTMPTFTDSGEYEVKYRVSYSYTFQHGKYLALTPETTTYTPYEGTAKVTINKRDITITAGSDQKTYDGTPLRNNSTTVTGTFANGEGIESVTMTDGSKQIEIGSTKNVIDQTEVKFKTGTKLENYNITYVDGLLTVVDISNGGGSDDYLDESKALMIVDHEACADGWVYLAFTPQFKTTPHIDINVWVERTAANKGFKFKYGRTREDCESCNPVSVELSQVKSHVADIKNNKIWVKVPLKNITNIASFTEDLVLNTGFVRLFVAGKADEWKYKYSEPQDVMLSNDGAVSINRFGILRNDSTTTNTMIAIPWTWYSETEETATDIPTRKLVKETHLSEGDTLLQFTKSGTYAAWYMFDNEWQTISTVKVSGFNDIEISDPKQDSGKMDIVEKYDLTIKRGRALWLCRQNPTVPFYVYGQDTQTDVITDIEPSKEEPTNQNASKTGVTSNAIGNPFTKEVSINDLVFDGEIDEKWDRLWIPNGTVTALYVIRMRGMWVYATLDPGTRRTKYVTDIKVKPGLGFWYDRRSTKPMKVEWPK